MAIIRNHYTIFADASFDPRTKSGFAGRLVLHGQPGSTLEVHAATEVELKQVHATTCARLELEAVIWGLESIEDEKACPSVTVYTDSKTIVDLPGRRQRLIAADFKSKATGRALNNSDLYIRFFALADLLQPEVTWLKGHKPSKQHTPTERLFAQVDQLTRQALRTGRADQA